MSKNNQVEKKGGSKPNFKKKWQSGTNYSTGLPLLKYGPDTNLATWKKEIMSAAMVLYGNLARLMATDCYYRTPLEEAPTVNLLEDPSTAEPVSSSSGVSSSGVSTRASAGRRAAVEVAGLDTVTPPADVVSEGEEMVKAWKIDRMRARMKAENKMLENRPNFYAYLEQHLSRESLDEVRKSEYYQRIDDAKDPLALWLTIKKTHEIATDSGVHVFRKRDSRANFMNVKQGPYESITVFKERFDHLYDAFVNAGNPEMTDEDIAADYLRSLDDGRYHELKIGLENEELMGHSAMPKTLNAMHALACKYKVMKKASVANHGTAFATSGGDVNG